MHAGKLDGDIELPPHYFYGLLRHFAADRRPAWREEARGAARARLDPLQRPRLPRPRGGQVVHAECFDAVGGIEERLDWDTIDETYARGCAVTGRARSKTAPPVITGPWIRGRPAFSVAPATASARTSLRYTPTVGAAADGQDLGPPPYVLSGLRFLSGYVLAWARRRPKLEDDDFRDFVRRELRGPARAATPPAGSCEALEVTSATTGERRPRVGLNRRIRDLSKSQLRRALRVRPTRGSGHSAAPLLFVGPRYSGALPHGALEGAPQPRGCARRRRGRATCRAAEVVQPGERHTARLRRRVGSCLCDARGARIRARRRPGPVVVHRVDPPRLA